ncbi:MAG: hypothetical protein ACLFPV_01305 [Spirochaetaceae bacterium]
MKFKIIFIIFNIVIVASFLFIFFMPAIFLGWEYSRLFWSSNWILGAAFVAVLGGLNAYFLSNWKLFAYLEREEWPRLIDYLEDQVYRKRRFNRQRIRILINAYIVSSRTDAITKLEEFLRTEKPQIIPRFSLALGVPHLLRNDPIDMELYYGELKDKKQTNDPLWVRWSYAFALMLGKKAEPARNELLSIAGDAKDPILRLLTAYLLDAYASQDQDVQNVVVETVRAVTGSYTLAAWRKEVERRRSNIQIVVLSKLIDDATAWAFETKSPGGSPGAAR